MPPFGRIPALCGARLRSPGVGSTPQHKHAVTPPKGRPTRSRHDAVQRQRVFGATARWVAVGILLVLAFVILVLVTDGGDFNPFNGTTAPPQPGTEIGVDSQPM
jgi:hypothetical protein